MQKQISNDETKHLVNIFLKNLEKKINSSSDVQAGLRFTRKKLTALSKKYDRNTLGHLCKNFLLALPNHVSPNPQALSICTANLMAEVYLRPLERGISTDTKLATFVTIRKAAFHHWFQITCDDKLKWREAFVLLAVIVAAERHEGALQSQIELYLQFEQRNIKKYLKLLLKKGLITCKGTIKDENIYDYHRNTDNLAHINSLQNIFKDFHPDKAWFSEIDPLKLSNEYNWEPYLAWRPVELKNPLFAVGGNSIDVHERALEVTLLASALLTRGQFRQWLESAHGGHYRQILPTIKGHIETTVKALFTIPHIKHAHYKQISETMPIVMYAGRSRFEIDLEYLIVLAEVVKQQIIHAYQDVKVAGKAFTIQLSLHPEARTHMNWDVHHFLDCFHHSIPWEKWKQKYPNRNPALPVGGNNLLQSQLKWVEIDKNLFSVKGIKSQIGFMHMAKEIYTLINLLNSRRVLYSLKEDTFLKGMNTLRSLTKTFDNPSHRMFTVVSSRQGIPSKVRPIFKCPAGLQFLMVDIKQAEFSIWIALAAEREESGSNDTEVDFSVVSMRLGIPRDKVKQAIYSYLNGAQPKTILRENGLTLAKWNKIKLESQVGRFSSLKKEIIDYAKKNGKTPPTPLRYSAPINSRHYRALAWYVQAIGAEIFRQWILNLKKEGLATAIVNLIHDEIIFKLPVSVNLYEITMRIEECLRDASNSILPKANFRIRAKAAKRWDEETAADIKV